MDPSKLEYLNKNHLMETWSQPDGLNTLANRAIGSIQEAFPDRCILVTRTHRQRSHTQYKPAITRLWTTSRKSHWLYRYGATESIVLFIQPSHQSRTTNILEIPKLAPYFFIEPDYGSQEAELMVKPVPQAQIGAVQFTCSGVSL